MNSIVVVPVVWKFVPVTVSVLFDSDVFPLDGDTEVIVGGGSYVYAFISVSFCPSLFVCFCA